MWRTVFEVCRNASQIDSQIISHKNLFQVGRGGARLILIKCEQTERLCQCHTDYPSKGYLDKTLSRIGILERDNDHTLARTTRHQGLDTSDKRSA